MTDHGSQLREAFETHENLAPDPAEVYARVRELSRGYTWRRRGVQAAGGVALGAGLIAGVVTVPGLLPGGSNDNVAVVQPGTAGALPALPPAKPSASPASSTPPATTEEKRFEAYFGAGYDYDDAVRLAKLWHMKVNKIGAVKAEAGRRLLLGETLPIKPTPGDDDSGVPATPSKEETQVSAFFEAGYDYDDAVTLSKLWKTTDPYQAKVRGGKKLLAGETLPIRP